MGTQAKYTKDRNRIKKKHIKKRIIQKYVIQQQKKNIKDGNTDRNISKIERETKRCEIWKQRKKRETGKILKIEIHKNIRQME